MKKNLFKFLILIGSTTSFAQTNYINKVWEKQNSLVGSQEKVATGIDPNGNLVYLGNQLNANNNSDIVLSCVHPNGNTVWQQICPSSISQDDYGTDLKIDNQGNIYVTGVYHNGSNTDYFTAKYNQMGVLQWQNIFNGNTNGDDVPSAITFDANQNVYVTGTSYGGFTMTDIVTVKYNSSGIQQWIKTYNFNNKVEIAQDILVDHAGDILILGTSANNWSNSDYIVRKYDANGNVLATKRHNSPGNGYDLPVKIIADINNNYYVTGTSENNGNKNIKTIAYQPNLQINWVDYIDAYSQTDEGFSLEIDDNNNIVVVGAVTKANGGKNGYIIKYTNTGAIEWSKEFCPVDETDIAKVKDILIENNEIYIGAETTTNNERNFMFICLDENGNIDMMKEVSLTQNDQVQKINKQNDNIYISGVSDSLGTKQVTTVKLAALKKNNAIVSDANGDPIAIDDEIIVRFNPNDLILNNIDDRDLKWGYVSDFLSPTAIAYFREKTKLDFGKLQCYKVFQNMTSFDTVMTSLTGETIKLPPFYATLGLILPTGTNEEDIRQILTTATPRILMVDLNRIYEHTIIPNDPYFTNGSSAGLAATTAIPDANINMTSAWDYEKGSPNIRVGIYDYGINKTHLDLSDGTIPSSVVKFSYDYYNNVSGATASSTDNFGVGSAITGIVAARNDNNIGISGIAGGQGNQNGVTIHDMKIFHDDGSPCGSPAILTPGLTSLSAIINAVLVGYYYKKQIIMNHSYFSKSYSPLLKEQFIYAYQFGTTHVTSSGNFAELYNSPCERHTYPNSYDDNLVLKVGGNDNTGNRASFSECGANIDIIAPSTNDLYTGLTKSGTGYTDSYQHIHPTCSPEVIDGTSFAAPHATGVAALMQSYYWNNIPSIISPNIENLLAPEDIEQMMQRNTTDITTNGGVLGYDDPTGSGRLNAGFIFDSLKYPEFLIYHVNFDVNLNNAVLVGSLENSCLDYIPQNTPWTLPLGAVKVNRWQVNATNTHTLPVGYNLIDGWVRGSKSTIYGVNSQSNSLYPCTMNNLEWQISDYYQQGRIPAAPSPYIVNNSLTPTSIQMTGYIYEVLDSNNNTIGWLPHAPNESGTFAYTLYLAQSDILNVNENELKSFKIYPNPSNTYVNIEFEKGLLLSINAVVLTDVTGKVVLNINPKNLNNSNNLVTFDVSKLSKGVYFVTVNSEDGKQVQKLIIE
jgi:hypothetical protein